MAYGDALGFFNENAEKKSLTLKNFVYRYNDHLSMEKPAGQYSYITELMLITIKCLVDHGTELKVTVDYPRFYEELKLWRYYRHGSPSPVLARLEKKNYYKSTYYWEDRNCCGISRIIPILLANKNYRAAEIEVYKNIIYINRHPKVILTGLLLLRTGYILLENHFIDEDELIQQLKNYLIHTQLQQLNENMKGSLPNHYNLQFEKEKIQYLMDLDRYKKRKDAENKSKQDLILNSIEIYYNLSEKDTPMIEDLCCDYGKEEIAVAFCFWGMSGKEYDTTNASLKDEIFIYEMGKFLSKLRNFEGNRKAYVSQDKMIDLFQLKKNSMIKHPILNMLKIKEKEETKEYIKLLVQTKSCINTFVKDKTRQ